MAFQQSEYSMLENFDQQICLVVTGGSLAPGITVSVTLSTQPGVSDGK